MKTYCPACAQPYEVPNHAVGRKSQCRKCGERFRIEERCILPVEQNRLAMLDISLPGGEMPAPRPPDQFPVCKSSIPPTLLDSLYAPVKDDWKAIPPRPSPLVGLPDLGVQAGKSEEVAEEGPSGRVEFPVAVPFTPPVARPLPPPMAAPGIEESPRNRCIACKGEIQPGTVTCTLCMAIQAPPRKQGGPKQIGQLILCVACRKQVADTAPNCPHCGALQTEEARIQGAQLKSRGELFTAIVAFAVCVPLFLLCAGFLTREKSAAPLENQFDRERDAYIRQIKAHEKFQRGEKLTNQDVEDLANGPAGR